MTRTALYSYRAARKDGVVELGTVEAASEEAVTSLLTNRGLFPVEVRRDAAGSDKLRELPADDLALGLRMLASFLEAGLPISRALAALTDVAPSSWLPLLDHVREEVRQGTSLGAALRSAPVVLPQIVVGVIQAGEAGSGLARGVRRSAALVESQVATTRAIRGALAYPIILAVAGSASLALLVGIVLPRFAAILTDLGQSLPLVTRILLGVSEASRVLFLPVLALGVIALLIWRGWVERDSGRARWHAFLLDLPVVGAIRASYATARITSALAGLLEAGVPLVHALLHVGRAGGDAAIGARVLAARTSITQGSGVAAAFDRERALTPTAIKLVRAGEETGQLAELLQHASQIEDDRAQQRVRSLVRLLEPMLIIGFGLVVAIAAAALLQAVYSVRPVS